jgi:hypothetical protein
MVEVEVTRHPPPEPFDDGWGRALAGLAAGAQLRLHAGSQSAVADRSLAVLIGLVRQAHRRQADVVWLDDPTPLVRTLDARGIPGWLIGTT